jgi:hypothetical protein
MSDLEQLRLEYNRASGGALGFMRAASAYIEALTRRVEESQSDVVRQADLIETLRAEVKTLRGQIAYHENEEAYASVLRQNDALRLETKRLAGERDEEYERHDATWGRINALLPTPPNTVWYMDPPDGGNVDQIDILRRYIADLRSRDPAVLQAKLTDGIDIEIDTSTKVIRVTSSDSIPRLTRPELFRAVYSKCKDLWVKEMRLVSLPFPFEVIDARDSGFEVYPNGGWDSELRHTTLGDYFPTEEKKE